MGSDLVASLQLLLAHIQQCNDKCPQTHLINDSISFVTLYFRLQSACSIFHSLDVAQLMIGFHTNTTYFHVFADTTCRSMCVSQYVVLHGET